MRPAADCTIASEEAYSEWRAEVDALLGQGDSDFDWRSAWEDGQRTRDAVAEFRAVSRHGR